MHRAIVGIYGALNILGGVGAYMMPSVKSSMSLIVGGATGLLLIVCSLIAKDRPGLAFRTAGMVTLGLSGFWIYRIVTLGQAGKSVGMAGGNLVLGLSVLAVLVLGHMAARRRA